MIREVNTLDLLYLIAAGVLLIRPTGLFGRA